MNQLVIRVVGAEYISDYKIEVTFNDGKKKLIDFKPLLKGSLFTPLLDMKNFIQYGITQWTIEWANGADFAPEYLYEVGEA